MTALGFLYLKVLLVWTKVWLSLFTGLRDKIHCFCFTLWIMTRLLLHGQPRVWNIEMKQHNEFGLHRLHNSFNISPFRCLLLTNFWLLEQGFFFVLPVYLYISLWDIPFAKNLSHYNCWRVHIFHCHLWYPEGFFKDQEKNVVSLLESC